MLQEARVQSAGRTVQMVGLSDTAQQCWHEKSGDILILYTAGRVNRESNVHPEQLVLWFDYFKKL